MKTAEEHFHEIVGAHVNGVFSQAKEDYYSMTQDSKEIFFEWLLRKGLNDLVVFFVKAELALRTGMETDPWEHADCKSCGGVGGWEESDESGYEWVECSNCSGTGVEPDDEED